MKFPWDKYEEITHTSVNTLQIFINNITLENYFKIIKEFQERGGEQINILGGEPFLHLDLKNILIVNSLLKIKTVIYSNGTNIDNFSTLDLMGAKVRLSLYCKSGGYKSAESLPKDSIPFDVCYMVSAKTTLDDLIESAHIAEKDHGCDTFFISNIRELDNPKQEFFEDTKLTMPVIEYKKLVHDFLWKYNGNMEIHISNRGVFQSTKVPGHNRCKFANIFDDGKIIQCPYDIINEKYQKQYKFNERFCQHSNSCLMTKIVLKTKNRIDHGLES